MSTTSPQSSAVIFDMDGVLLDSEPLHYEAVRIILAEQGVDFPLEDYFRYLGTTLTSTWDDLCDRYPITMPFAQFEARYNADVLAHYRAGAPLIRGARELVEQLREAGVPIAVASSSHRMWVDAALKGAGLSDYFDQTTAGDEVSMGKPSPEIYLKAAEKLGFDPARCIAIEDAPAGVESASAAGMKVVLVRSELTDDLNLTSDWQVDDLTEFKLTWLSEPSADLVGAA
ncbi:MAG: HAD family phosphatase [Chloroflexi bacterium]|nr:HAD family phosphatase [Chloroflexota bacterium]MCY3687207.1 HAD family phosphatase [Chloroflexota bacterium]MCY3697004.1 HAD family phosphatase [Chloroflexota bacterium]